MGDTSYRYTGPSFPDVSIQPIPYQGTFFDLEIALESELFYELRLQNGIEPARLSDSKPEELAVIRDFFEGVAQRFYFLFDGPNLIGSVLVMGNAIQSLAVARPYQRMGHGTQLVKFACNGILSRGFPHVAIKILHGNQPALGLYQKLGFQQV